MRRTALLLAVTGIITIVKTAEADTDYFLAQETVENLDLA